MFFQSVRICKDPPQGGYLLIWAMYVCASAKGMVLAPALGYLQPFSNVYIIGSLLWLAAVGILEVYYGVSIFRSPLK